MDDKRISDLTAITTIDDADVLPIVDTSDTTTKKVTITQMTEKINEGILPDSGMQQNALIIYDEETPGKLFKGTNIIIANEEDVSGIGDLSVDGETTLNGNVEHVADTTLSALDADTVPYLNGDKEVKSSAVTPTELGYLAGIFSQPIARGIMTVFSTSGIWTKSDLNPKFVKVTVIGGGGGGGGISTTGASEGAMSGAGGGGGASISTILAADLGATETVTVGAGGAGGAAGENDGSTGGTSSFGTHASATGGEGGAGGADTAGTTNEAGGDGGVGSLGDLNLTGGDGTTARVYDGLAIRTGVSGASFFGGGKNYSTSSAGNAVDATNYGEGGGGAANGSSQSSRAGGNGFAGIVIVEEYI